MKLTKIIARNLQGSSFELDLRAINLLIGPNYVGKTTRANAVILLLIGYLPKLGKLPSATFGLCSGRELYVEGHFDDPATSRTLIMWRRWYLSGDKVKTEKHIPTQFEQAEGQQLAVMLNAEEYFSQSDRERAEYVFANVSGASMSTPGQILSRVHGALSEDQDLSQEAVKKITDDFAKMMEGEEEGNALFAGWTTQTFVDWAIESSATLEKEAKSAAAVFEKTVQGLAYLRTQDATSKSAATIAGERDAAAKELEEKVARREVLSQQALSARRAAMDRDTATKALAGKAEAEAKVARCTELVASITAEMEALPNVTKEDLDDDRAEEQDASNAVTRLGTKKEGVEIRISTLENERAGLGSQEKCPYCGATGGGWKALKEAEITSELAQVQQQHEALKEELVHAAHRLDRARQARTSRAALNAKRAEKRLALDNAQWAQTAAEKELATITAKQQVLDSIVVPVVDESAIDALGVEIDALRVKYAKADAELKATLGRENDLKRLAEAESAREEQVQYRSAAKAMSKLFQGERDSLVTAIFGPLIERANSLFGHLMLTPLAYHDGMIGTWRGGIFVTHRTLSGAEELLTFTAIQAALSSQCPIRITFIDEMGRFTLGTGVRVVNQIWKAITEKAVDQFIGIVAVDPNDAASFPVLNSYKLMVADHPEAQVIALNKEES